MRRYPTEHPELASLMALPFIPIVLIWIGLAYITSKVKDCF